jgi:hypothetical protein
MEQQKMDDKDGWANCFIQKLIDKLYVWLGGEP